MASDRAHADEVLSQVRAQFNKNVVDFSSRKQLDFGLLKEKSVLITGGSKGLGAAYTTAFASHGAYVTACDTDEKAGKALAQSLTSEGPGKVHHVTCDVNSWDSLVAAFKAAIYFSPHNTIDIVIPNAGVVGTPFYAPPQDPSELSIDKDPSPPLLRTIQTNLIAEYNTAHLALHYFNVTTPNSDTKPDKSLIIISSIAGYASHNALVDYIVSKMGARGIFKALCGQLPFMVPTARVRLNMLAPTYIKTNIFNPSSKEKNDQIIETIEKGLGGRFADVRLAVDAVLRLACDTEVDCRAVCVGAEGNFDLCDDAGGYDGGVAMWEKGASTGMFADKYLLKEAGLPDDVTW